jgi:hypothetical protein
MPTKEEMRDFAHSIEKLVADTNYTYIEAVVEYCNSIGLEIEVAASLINSNLKSKIASNASDLNLFKEKTTKLPI